MNSRLRVLILVLALSSVVAVASPWGRTVTVEAMPPVVVLTVPRSGDVLVDPSLTEIRVTFSKDMQQSWAWLSVTSSSLPEFTGKAKFLADRRTCVAPVRLEPGRAYAIAFNSEKNQGFKDLQGKPAIPYLLVFETRGPGGS